jgi:hypothetical protein
VNVAKLRVAGVQKKTRHSVPLVVMDLSIHSFLIAVTATGTCSLLCDHDAHHAREALHAWKRSHLQIKFTQRHNTRAGTGARLVR